MILPPAPQDAGSNSRSVIENREAEFARTPDYENIDQRCGSMLARVPDCLLHHPLYLGANERVQRPWRALLGPLNGWSVLRALSGDEPGQGCKQIVLLRVGAKFLNPVTRLDQHALSFRDGGAQDVFDSGFAYPIGCRLELQQQALEGLEQGVVELASNALTLCHAYVEAALQGGGDLSEAQRVREACQAKDARCNENLKPD